MIVGGLDDVAASKISVISVKSGWRILHESIYIVAVYRRPS